MLDGIRHRRVVTVAAVFLVKSRSLIGPENVGAIGTAVHNASTTSQNIQIKL